MVNGHNQDHLSVRLWHGYVTGLFYARPADSEVALFASPAFRRLRFPLARQSSVAERSRAALDALVEELTANGWQMEEQRPGAAWYELEFVRPPKLTKRPPRRTRSVANASPGD